jgi:hypothetical protein
LLLVQISRASPCTILYFSMPPHISSDAVDSHWSIQVNTSLHPRI